MKAAQFNKYGGSEVVEINENAPKPTAAKGKVLIEVYAASLNPVDWKIRAGYMKEMVPLQFPVTLGGDFSGVVKQVCPSVGGGVLDFKVGDKVYGQAIVLNGGSGAFAEFVASNVANIALKPKGVDYIEAASLPLVGTSAIQVLEEHIKLKSGQKILIHGGSGGIGTIAIQLAKSMGAYVATTVSADNKEYAKRLGADEAIDYKNEAFGNFLKGFDAVFDTVGGETLDRSFKVLKKGGIIVSMLGAPNPELAKQYGVRAIGQMTNTNAARLTRASELVDNGAIKAQIAKVFPLEMTKEAFDYLEKGHPRGKVVLKIKG